MMPTDFDKALDRYLGPRNIPPGEPETCGLGGLDRVGTGEPAREAPPPVPAPAPLRPGAPGFAEAVTRLLGLPLDRFAKAGQMLEIGVPWHRVTLWLVPDDGAAQSLEAEGVSRGRIWTARELGDLLSVPRIQKTIAQTVALTKLEFDGEVTEVRPSSPPSDPAGPGVR
jgi:hypothetical protein